MQQHRSKLPWGAVLFLITFVSVPGHGRAQEGQNLSREEGITIDRGQAVTQVPILFEEFTAVPGATPDDVEQVEGVVATDLDYSGFFSILRIPTLTGDETLPAGRSQALVRGSVEVVGDEIILHGTLESLPGRDLIFTRDYRTRAEWFREAAHRFSDDIVLYLTGQEGIARTRIAFVSDRTGNKELYVVDYDGHGMRTVTQNGTINLSPTWSPDGKRLAFVSYLNGDPDIFEMDLTTGKTRLLAGGPGVQGAPNYSPDGQYLAYSHTNGRESEIYVSRTDGSGALRLTRIGGINTCPSWSPDSRRLVFTSDRSGRPQLYVIDADGGQPRRLTFNGGWNDIPDWSPKGDRIVFTSRSEGAFRVSMVEPSGIGDEIQQTYGPGSDEHARWSPNGRHVVYESSRGGRKGLYVLDVDSRTNRILMRGGANYFGGSWSPIPSREAN